MLHNQYISIYECGEIWFFDLGKHILPLHII